MVWVLIGSFSAATAFLMGTHNICFRGEIRKISILLDWKKASYQELCLRQKKNVFLETLQTLSFFVLLNFILKHLNDFYQFYAIF